MATFSRQMLSRHKTTATYEGQEEGRESMLKVRRQNFNELKRAPQQTVQRFTDLEGDHAATVAKLSKGDKVRLEWDHNYVTRSENGGESKYPERVITALEPVA